MKSLLADIILVVHFLFIAFVVGGQGCILVGAFRRWAWVRRRGFRVVHVVAIAIVAVQAWVGMVCPLTVWENVFRRAAGEIAYPGSFVGYWLSKLVYFDAPQWVFTTTYTLFGLTVVASWFIVKPVKEKRPNYGVHGRLAPRRGRPSAILRPSPSRGVRPNPDFKGSTPANKN